MESIYNDFSFNSSWWKVQKKIGTGTIFFVNYITFEWKSTSILS